jgi:hypothetical protein
LLGEPNCSKVTDLWVLLSLLDGVLVALKHEGMSDKARESLFLAITVFVMKSEKVSCADIIRLARFSMYLAKKRGTAS